MNILFILSGSVACYKACFLISRLAREGHEVKTAVTENALQFIGAATLESLTSKTVYSDMFGKKEQIEHVSLSKWADVTILCPATANIINKMAAGIGDDCASTLFLAADLKKPFIVVPAMNVNMYEHPSVTRGIKQLKDWGVKVMGPAVGRQACGDVGPGRMPEPEDIYKFIKPYLK